MRAREYILEYNQTKTAQVFGNKLLTALRTDTGNVLSHGDARAYLNQKDKIKEKPDAEHIQYIVTKLLSDIETADPTPNKEYTQWLAKVYANEKVKLEDILSKGADWLKAYHQMKLKKLLPLEWRNIANFKFTDLAKVALDPALTNKLTSAEDAMANKGKSEVILDTAEVRIIHPDDESAACYYGQGTRWCTAAKNNNMFHSYHTQGPMFILLPKQPKHNGEKYQIHFASGQFMNEDDKEVNIRFLLQERFGNLVDFFKKIDPNLSNLIIFVDDGKLESLMKQFNSLVLEHINEIESDWEANDDSYYDLLQAEGYVEENGEIDWERAPGYLDFNDEARELYDLLIDSINLRPDDIKEWANQYTIERDNSPNLDKLEKVIAFAVDNFDYGTSTYKDAGKNLAEWIRKNIIVSDTQVR